MTVKLTLAHLLLTLTHVLNFSFPKGGETIKNINQQSGAHVELQRNPPPNTDPNVRIFSIRGTSQQMEMARQLIDEKIGVGGPFYTHPPPQKAIVWPDIHEGTCQRGVQLVLVPLPSTSMSPGVKHEESIKWT